jgi:putative transposase
MARTGNRYTKEQIIGILKEAAAAKNTGDVIRRQGASAHTYYQWKTNHAGMDVCEARPAAPSTTGRS